MRNNHISVLNVLGIKLFFLIESRKKTLYAIAYKNGKIYELPELLRRILKFKNN